MRLTLAFATIIGVQLIAPLELARVMPQVASVGAPTRYVRVMSHVDGVAAPTEAARADATRDPRALATAALKAASTSSAALGRWSAPWQNRLQSIPSDRTALFAVAMAERLNYRFVFADSLLKRVVMLGSTDRLARQAQFYLALSLANAGHYKQAGVAINTLEENALRAGDTLSALDAILAHSGAVMRSDGANAGMTVLSRGDSLNWRREPALDASARCRLSNIHSRLGNRERARTLAREGYAVAMRADLTRHAAACLFTLATEFARTGLTDSLRDPLQTAIEMQKKSGDLAGLSASQQWSGYYLISLGKYSLAQAQLQSAWTAAQRSGSVNTSAWIAINRAALAKTFYDAANYSLWLARGDTLMRAMDDLQGLVEVTRMQGARAQRAGDNEAADRFLRAAKTAADAMGEPGVLFSIAAARWDLAMTRGRIDEAALFMDERRSFVDRYKLDGWTTGMITDEAEMALRRGEPDKAIALLDKSLPRLHPSQQRFINTAQQERALALAMMGESRNAALAALTAAETFDKWRASLSDRSLQTLSVQAQSGDGWFTSSLISTLAASGETEVAFSLAERRRARDLRDRLALAASFRADSTAPDSASQSTLSVPDLQRALRDNQTALVMLDAGENGARGTAFVLTKRQLTAHVLPALNEVSPRIRRLVALLESGRDAGVEARALGTSLIAPMLPHLDSAGITRLVFLPEGVLHRLPFDVLQLPDGRFLVERFETAVAPSATVLARLAAQPNRRSGAPRVLAFADAAGFREQGNNAAPDSPLFTTLFGSVALLPRLVGARNEVASVQRAMPETIVRMGTNATESNIKREAAAFDILHFATHASVDEWSGANAALALTPGAGDDGMFDSSEIARLNLSASLVVLSACRTVGGEVIAGEGVRGLTGAFLRAGAQSVIATAWRVNDRDVVPVVAAFYQQLAAHKSVGGALREAQLAAIKRKVSPSVWGAFTLVGDPWRVVVNTTP